MNCEQVEGLLSAYLDNKLVIEERLSIMTHLQMCKECTTICMDYLRFDTLLAHLPYIQPKKTLYDKIFSSVEYKQFTGTFGNQKYVDGTIKPSTYKTERHYYPHLVLLPKNASDNQKPTYLHPTSQKHKPIKSDCNIRIFLLLIIIGLLAFFKCIACIFKEKHS